MPDMIAVLACLSQCLDPTTRRQLRRITEAMLSMTGRVTMRGMARWAGPGGSDRTVQRFCQTSLSWGRLQWMVIRHHLLDQDDVIVMAGDDVVVTKAGKQTHGLRSVFFLPVWEKSPRAGVSECILAECQTPHLVPGHDGTTGSAASRDPSRGRQAKVRGETGAPPREQKSASARGGVESLSAFCPRDDQALTGGDRRSLTGDLLCL